VDLFELVLVLLLFALQLTEPLENRQTEDVVTVKSKDPLPIRVILTRLLREFFPLHRDEEFLEWWMLVNSFDEVSNRRELRVIDEVMLILEQVRAVVVTL